MTSPEPILYHIIPKDDWEKAQAEGSYTPPSIAAEGFIHTSRADQTLPTANLYYKGRTDLVLLNIVRAKVGPEVKDDPVPNRDDHFAHIYGSLNLDAVEGCEPFLPSAEGVFEKMPTF